MEVITEGNRYMFNYAGGSQPGSRPVEIYKEYDDRYFGKDLNTGTVKCFSKAKIANFTHVPDNPFEVPS